MSPPTCQSYAQLDPPRRQVVREGAAGRAGPEHLLAHRLGLLGLAEVRQRRRPRRRVSRTGSVTKLSPANSESVTGSGEGQAHGQ